MDLPTTRTTLTVWRRGKHNTIYMNKQEAFREHRHLHVCDLLPWRQCQEILCIHNRFWIQMIHKTSVTNHLQTTCSCTGPAHRPTQAILSTTFNLVCMEWESEWVSWSKLKRNHEIAEALLFHTHTHRKILYFYFKTWLNHGRHFKHFFFTLS